MWIYLNIRYIWRILYKHTRKWFFGERNAFTHGKFSKQNFIEMYSMREYSWFIGKCMGYGRVLEDDVSNLVNILNFSIHQYSKRFHEIFSCQIHESVESRTRIKIAFDVPFTQPYQKIQPKPKPTDNLPTSYLIESVTRATSKLKRM